MCHISMDLSQQALQTNEKFFFKIQRLSFLNFGRKSKYIQKNSEAWILVNQFAMSYKWMDLSQRSLQTNGNFFQISNSFLNFWPKT